MICFVDYSGAASTAVPDAISPNIFLVLHISITSFNNILSSLVCSGVASPITLSNLESKKKFDLFFKKISDEIARSGRGFEGSLASCGGQSQTCR